MNQKIKDLKINIYKQKILSRYDFLNIITIYYGKEDQNYSDFSKKIINNNELVVKEFSIYDAEKHVYMDIEEVYEKAFYYFIGLLNIFKDDENIIFNINYNAEGFRVKCCFLDFKMNFKKIEHLEKTVIFYNSEKTKFISILRAEYSYEIILYKVEEFLKE